VPTLLPKQGWRSGEIYLNLYEKYLQQCVSCKYSKLAGYKRSSPLLLLSLLCDRTGKNYTVCCNAYALHLCQDIP